MPASANKKTAENFAAAMDRIAFSGPAAVAVSGGGDSIALMHLYSDWCRTNPLPALQAPQPAPQVRQPAPQVRQPALQVVTVDHALRPGSDAEAQKVVHWAQTAGLKATVLTRTGPAPDSDIEAAARLARYSLIGAWAKTAGIKTILLAHTLDDQAETFLMRLIRGSGVDGLSAMQPLAPFPHTDFPELTIARPLLDFSRSELRRYLKACDAQWIEDPMNDDPRFTRVRLRQAAPQLAALGLSPRRLADAAKHLGRVRTTLEHATEDLAGQMTEKAEDGMLLDGDAFARADEELALRLLADLLTDVGGQIYRPRFVRLSRLYQAILDGQLHAGRTLHGCKISPAPRRLAKFGPGSIFIRPEKGRTEEITPSLLE